MKITMVPASRHGPEVAQRLTISRAADRRRPCCPPARPTAPAPPPSQRRLRRGAPEPMSVSTISSASSAVSLGDQQLIIAQPRARALRRRHVGVNERGHPARALRLGQAGHGEGGLARALRPWIQRCARAAVRRHRGQCPARGALGNSGDVRRFCPRRITEPPPNCLVTCEIARSRSLRLSSDVIAIVLLLSDCRCHHTTAALPAQPEAPQFGVDWPRVVVAREQGEVIDLHRLTNTSASRPAAARSSAPPARTRPSVKVCERRPVHPLH